MHACRINLCKSSNAQIAIDPYLLTDIHTHTHTHTHIHTHTHTVYTYICAIYKSDNTSFIVSYMCESSIVHVAEYVKTLQKEFNVYYT